MALARGAGAHRWDGDRVTRTREPAGGHFLKTIHAMAEHSIGAALTWLLSVCCTTATLSTTVSDERMGECARTPAGESLGQTGLSG